MGGGPLFPKPLDRLGGYGRPQLQPSHGAPVRADARKVALAVASPASFAKCAVRCQILGSKAPDLLKAQLVVVDSTADLDTKGGADCLKFLIDIVAKGLPVVTQAAGGGACPQPCACHRSASRIFGTILF